MKDSEKLKNQWRETGDLTRIFCIAVAVVFVGMILANLSGNGSRHDNNCYQTPYGYDCR